MFTTLLGRKKISEEKLAILFTRSLINMIDEGFPELVGFVNDNPEFVLPPELDASNDNDFLIIVLTANISRISKRFESGKDKRIVSMVIDEAAVILSMDNKHLAGLIHESKKFMSRVNYPSKNICYAMSKAFFHKYTLNPFQEPYFKSLNTPNPIFLKKLDEAMNCFLWDWESFDQKYKVTT